MLTKDEKNTDEKRRAEHDRATHTPNVAPVPESRVSLDLDIENSTLMTATRNAGSLVLATCPGSLPLVPAALRQSPSACFFLCVFARARRNSSYLASYIPSINYHRRLIISGLRIFMRLRGKLGVAKVHAMCV
mgnify:CR=1 FL=1